MKKILITMSIISYLFGCAQQPETIKILEKQAFKKAIESKKVQLVDVRTATEYNSGHIKTAKNIDVFKISKFTEEFNKLDKNQPVYVYCRSGKRSNSAAKKLDKMGFKEIYDLKGGYLNWIK
ncbi:rhodanese-like domain-containing protein [Neotamlana laminarinivorans]|uniref:Rhodanese-like domain-containing protein n=1 Tax=Neotamlana laminarinivorans TaxID=2883124 RepID=A0A9X1HZK8_9FLAO|nr:rhodanese-like domain-containing protein [Tamlana laminarinivorans]MCB4797868.1 rhodanese-like domain-containing protein [Tamlana laminarinivorans]